MSATAWATGSFDPAAPRGASIEKFAVPGKTASEICVVPKHLPFGDYSAKDAQKEKDLCSYNFYESDGTTGKNGAVAICPKTNSTSAAVIVFSIPDGKTKSDLETSDSCLALEAKGKEKPDGVKTIAKFKQTDDHRTCTYTQSDLAYYHVSRALGNIANVVPSVIRTMDFGRHDKVVSQALSIGKVQHNSNLLASWQQFKAMSSGSASNPASVFTVDNTQLYGALLGHGSDDGWYRDWITDQSSAQTHLPDVRAFKNVSNSASAASILGSRDWNAANAQALLAMRDMGDMLLLDFLMQQNDRFTGNNIEFANEVVYKDAKGIHHAKDAKDVPAGTPSFPVKRVVLGDNDCGLIEGPGAIVKGGFLAEISHMHPDTYVRLMQFAHLWETDPSVKSFFESEALFSEKLAANFSAGLFKARDTLKARCKASDHFLDLDSDNFFSGKDVDKSLCDATTLAALATTDAHRMPAAQH